MNHNGTFWLPISGSTMAPQVDSLFNFILYISIFFFLLITIGTTYFVWKYRQQGALRKTSGVAHNTTLELVWTIIPSIILIIIFIWGFNIFLKLTIVPKDALQIKLTGQKWFWSFAYPNGATTVNELVVPVNKPVGMLMTSKDVIHSFFIPAFRIKYDVLPNRYTQTWFEATQIGEYQIFCAEYCGTKHSEMLAKVKVVSAVDYQKWLDNAGAGVGGNPAEAGAKLYQSKACFTCHSIDGNKAIGPTFKGLFGRSEQFTDGSKGVADENYLRESILIPAKKVVMGYQPVMPPYQGVLKDAEVDALIEYIKSLK